MSWCRWGSLCWETMPRIYLADLDCESCPGSSVYVYEVGDDLYECCACDISETGRFSEAGMLAHLLEHDARGDHVRRSLLLEARGASPVPHHAGPDVVFRLLQDMQEARFKAFQDAFMRAAAKGAP
jgi:hypothetical protein